MSRYTLLTLIGAMVVVTGCAKKSPLTPATPWADIADDALCFLTTATDPSGLKVQYIFDWGNGDTTTTGFFASGDTASCPRSFPDTGTFHIKVKARNEAGRLSKWSDECLFHASRPPQLADTIVGFTRWAVDRWYRPSVKVTDPDGDSVSVKFIWGDSTPSNWSPFIASGGTVTDSVKWQTTGRRVVRVVLKDKGSMVNYTDAFKMVNVSEVGVLWSSAEFFESFASPVLGMADGRVVVCLVDDYGVACVNPDGSTRWRWENEPMSDMNGPSTSADGSRLYVADENRGVICFDVATGAVNWQLAQPNGDCTPVVGPGTTLYTAGRDAITRIQDLSDTASVDWTYTAGLRQFTNIVLGADRQIYGVSYDGWELRRPTVFAMDSTGALLWQDSTRVMDYGYFMFCPALDSRGRLVIASGEDSLVCFNPDGSVAWSASAGGYIYGGGITIGYDDRIYVLSDDGSNLFCIDEDGVPRWRAEIPEGANWNNVCALADSTVLAAGGYDDYVTCIDWEGNMRWEFMPEDSLYGDGRRRGRRDEGDEDPSPIVGSDGNIYMFWMDGLCCLGYGNARLANTGWPTYNHDGSHSGWAGRQQQ
jgi:outer membrane protein assembly factor BamB